MPPRRGGNSPRTNFIVGVYPSRIRESSTYVDPVDEFDDIVADIFHGFVATISWILSIFEKKKD